MISSHPGRIGAWAVLAAAVGALPFAAARLQAQQTTTATATLVHNFTATEAPGGNPAGPGGLIQGSDGNFYGTTTAGGTNGQGSIYRLTPAGVLTILYSFSPLTNNQDGAGPGNLIRGHDGNFYGTTIYGGPQHTGTFFRITPAGAFTVLHSFDGIDGNDDNVEGDETAVMTVGSDGNFYGTGAEGGAHDAGTIFKITPAGQLTVLHTFDAGTRVTGGYVSNDDGYNPSAPIQGEDGNFYGTTYQGGSSGTGTVYRLTPGGTLTLLHTFAAVNSYQDSRNADGIGPVGGVTLGPDGNLYGKTIVGGANLCGTIFKITPAGVFTLLHTFTLAEIGSTDGAVPLEGSVGGKLVVGNDGNLYGTIYEGPSFATGAVYRITAAGAFASLHQFSAATGQTSTGCSTNAEGLYPGGLIQGSDGALYGVAGQGGATGLGTIYKLTVPGVHPSFFDGEAALGGGVYYLAFADGNPFGYYSYLSDQRYLYHFDLGYEYVFDGFDGKDGVYLYDFASRTFFYTSPVFPFPYLYDFSLNSVLYYYPDPEKPGRYDTGGVRYFYDFSTGKIIHK